MNFVGAGLGHNVDGTARRSSQIRRVVAAIDLEFLDRILADRETHAASIISGFATIHGDAIASAVAAVKGMSTLRCLFYSEILVAGQPRGVGNARRQQSKCEVIAAINGQVSDVLLVDPVGLASPLGFDGGGLTV